MLDVLLYYNVDGGPVCDTRELPHRDYEPESDAKARRGAPNYRSKLRAAGVKRSRDGRGIVPDPLAFREWRYCIVYRGVTSSNALQATRRTKRPRAFGADGR